MTVVPSRLPMGDMPTSVSSRDFHLRVEFNPKAAMPFAIPASPEIGMVGWLFPEKAILRKALMPRSEAKMH
jgi:hypothetical protein